MYNGTRQGPSFAPRMKIHPSLLHDGLPQIPFPAHTLWSVLFSLFLMP